MHFAAGSKFQPYELSLWLTGKGFALLEKSPAVASKIANLWIRIVVWSNLRTSHPANHSTRK